MTPDEHQREKMRLWAWMYENNFIKGNPPEWCSDFADTAVAEFDKRFPAPASPSEPKVQAAAEVAPALPKAIASTQPMSEHRKLMEWTEHLQLKERRLEQQEALLADELTTLREKARYWDAVASGKVRLVRDEDATNSILWGAVYNNSHSTDWYISAAGAVQAAIDEGALK